MIKSRFYFNRWGRELMKKGILQEDNGHLILKTPFTISILKDINEEIIEKYDPDFEKGGILLALPKRKQGETIFEIRKIIFLENKSSHPEFEYKFSIEDVIDKIETCSKYDKKYYIPIQFHTHPLIDIVDLASQNNINSFLRIIKELQTSPTDQDTSFNLFANIGDVNFLMPCCLIFESNFSGNRIIISFFGGNIAPTDFNEYLNKLTGVSLATIVQMIKDWVNEDPNRIWWLVGLGGVTILGLILLCVYAKDALPVLVIFIIILMASDLIPMLAQSTFEIPNYFSVVKEANVFIQIPRY